LAEAASRFGRDLRLEEAGEELVCARHAEQAAQAERLAAVDADPAWPLLAAETRASLARMEAEIWAARVSRHPREPLPHAELARRLTSRGDWLQALAAWADTIAKCDEHTPRELVGEAWLRLAESRQRLRRFDDAKAAYRHVVELADHVAGHVGDHVAGHVGDHVAGRDEPSATDCWDEWRQAACEQLERLGERPPPPVNR
jgi:tetratricopeptide (TPR) repeat protein